MKLIAHMHFTDYRKGKDARERRNLLVRHGCNSVFSLPTDATTKSCACGKVTAKYVKADREKEDNDQKKGTVYILGEEGYVIDLDNTGWQNALEQYDSSQAVLKCFADVSEEAIKTAHQQYNTKFRSMVQLEPTPVIVRVETLEELEAK